MSLSIFDDDDLVESLGYSRDHERNLTGYSYTRSSLVARGKREERGHMRAVRILVGRSKRLTGTEAYAVATSTLSLTELSKRYGISRAAVAYYRRLVRERGLDRIESVARACLVERAPDRRRTEEARAACREAGRRGAEATRRNARAA